MCIVYTFGSWLLHQNIKRCGYLWYLLSREPVAGLLRVPLITVHSNLQPNLSQYRMDDQCGDGRQSYSGG